MTFAIRLHTASMSQPHFAGKKDKWPHVKQGDDGWNNTTLDNLARAFYGDNDSQSQATGNNRNCMPLIIGVATGLIAAASGIAYAAMKYLSDSGNNPIG